MITKGTSRVVSKKDFLFTRVMYSLSIIRLILFILLYRIVILFLKLVVLYGAAGRLKFTRQRRSFHQPDENIIQGGQYFVKGYDLVMLGQQIL